MSSSLSDKLLNIDNRLQQLAEEKESLLNERNSILAQQEVELAKHFNQHVSPEAKVDLFISYFSGRNHVYPFRWESQNGRLKEIGRTCVFGASQETTGSLKASTTKWGMISRRAYGFRSFENNRIRVMTHCGWDYQSSKVNADPPFMG